MTLADSSTDDLLWPHITAGIPGIGGKLKAEPVVRGRYMGCGVCA
ncbi:MAG: hypothetical protein ACE5LU_26035 [Anaerolineae bacterium]